MAIVTYGDKKQKPGNLLHRKLKIVHSWTNLYTQSIQFHENIPSSHHITNAHIIWFTSNDTSVKVHHPHASLHYQPADLKQPDMTQQLPNNMVCVL